MTFRLLLFLIATLFATSKTEGQILVEQAIRNGLEINGNVKEVIRTSYKEDQEYKFDLNLLKYRRDSSSSTSTYLFNKENQIVSIVKEYYSRNDTTDTVNFRYVKQEYDYDSGYLTVASYQPGLDSLKRQGEFIYIFDDNNRVTQVKDVYKNTVNQLEEIKYTSGSKISTIYYFNRLEHRDTLVTLFNLDGNILTQKHTTDGLPQFCFYREYTYDAEGKVNTILSRRYEEIDYFKKDMRGDIGEIDASKDKWGGTRLDKGNYFSGKGGKEYCGYLEKYYYNSKGVLKKTKNYYLKKKEVNGKYEFLPKALYTKTKYKEKKVDDYILQVVKKNYLDKPYKISSQKILDHNRSTVLKYDETSKFVDIWDITYYD